MGFDLQTCRAAGHGAERLSHHYGDFVAERAALPATNRRQLERNLQRKYGLSTNTVVEAKNGL